LRVRIMHHTIRSDEDLRGKDAHPLQGQADDAARLEELTGKNCPTGMKFPGRRKLDFKSPRKKSRQEVLGPFLRFGWVLGQNFRSEQKSR